VTKNFFTIILILLILLITTGVVLVHYLSKSEAIPETEKTKSAAEKGVILELFSPKNEYKTGEIIKVEVQLDSGDELVEGVDILLYYNPNFLKLKTENGFLNTSESIFSTFPSPKVNIKKGEIIFSALASPPKGNFKGKGKIATLTFEAIKKGETTIEFAFTPGATRDSNVSSFSEPKDLLEKVKNLKLKIY